MSERVAKYSITMPGDIAAAARARSGPTGLSAYVAAAVARQLERDGLDDLIRAAEADHGPITEAELALVRDDLHRAERAQAQRSSGAA